MTDSEQTVQTFLDAVADRSCFCEGRVVKFERHPGPITNTPNCGAHDECPLHRNASTRTVRMFLPRHGGSSPGCLAYQQVQQWNKSQQEWIVQLEGQSEITVCASDPLGAAVAAFIEQNKSDGPIDKRVMFDRRYTVREA